MPRAKDDDLLTTLEVCYEFYLRGFTFAPIDIYHSHATKFQIEAGQLRRRSWLWPVLVKRRPGTL